ncbi:hypothetical protein ACSX02_12355, partial [Staphylococcus epidermidis]|uniref:hypothetical protein n=1 Tax=Staphylococcus epidermidis TaxID=1282 RepID=UPI003EE678F5
PSHPIRFHSNDVHDYVLQIVSVINLTLFMVVNAYGSRLLTCVDVMRLARNVLMSSRELKCG